MFAARRTRGLHSCYCASLPSRSIAGLHVRVRFATAPTIQFDLPTCSPDSNLSSRHERRRRPTRAAPSREQGDEHLKRDRLDDAAGCYRRALAIRSRQRRRLRRPGIRIERTGNNTAKPSNICGRRCRSIREMPTPTTYWVPLRTGRTTRPARSTISPAHSRASRISCLPTESCMPPCFGGARFRQAKEVLHRRHFRLPRICRVPVLSREPAEPRRRHESAVACYDEGVDDPARFRGIAQEPGGCAEQARPGRPGCRELSEGRVVRTEFPRSAPRPGQRHAESGKARSGCCVLRVARPS